MDTLFYDFDSGDTALGFGDYLADRAARKILIITFVIFNRHSLITRPLIANDFVMTTFYAILPHVGLSAVKAIFAQRKRWATAICVCVNTTADYYCHRRQK